jgi:tetratricopeptide (TPR) repeat protein
MNRSSLAGLLILFLAIVLPAPFAIAAGDYQQAVTYYSQGKYAEAIKELTPVMEKNRDWEPGHRILGLCYLGIKDYKMAESSFLRAQDLKSDAYQTYFGLGQARFYQKKYESAIPAFDKAEQLSSPANVKAAIYEMRGTASFEIKKYTDAINDLAKSVQADSSDAATVTRLGYSYFNLNRIDDAIPALEKALSLKPGDPGINETLGNAYLKKNRIDDAIPALEKALSLKPGNSEITERLGKAYLKKGGAALSNKHYPEAAQLLLKAKGYIPKEGYVYYNLGEAYKFQQNYTEAEKELNQALAIMPQSVDVYRDLGYVYEMQKKWDTALNAYKKAEEISPIKWVQDAIKRVTESKKTK